VRVPPSLQPEQVLIPSTLGTQYTSKLSADTEGGSANDSNAARKPAAAGLERRNGARIGD
jgi:hypothetical protein